MAETKMKMETFDFEAAEDLKPQRRGQFFAAFSASLGSLALGVVLGWSSPAEPFLVERGLTVDERAWVGATATLAAGASVLPAGAALDAFGRKRTMLALSLPFIAGWLVLALAEPVWALVVGRALTGAAGGAFSVAVPAYVAETAHASVRGALGSLFQLLLVGGIECVYAFGAAGMSLRNLTLACTATPVIFALLFAAAPESPAYLLKRGDEAGARRALLRLRGRAFAAGAEAELQTLGEVQRAEAAARERQSALQVLWTPAVRRGLFIAIGLMTFLQLSGVNAVIFFAEPIFESTGSALKGSAAALVVGGVQVVATVVAGVSADRAGRRPLLMLSAVVMAASCGALGAFFFLKEAEDPAADGLGWLPLAALCLFIVAFSLGYGPVPWMMLGELFPQNARGPAAAFACVINWALAFLITRFFPNVRDALGAGPTFWGFAALSVVGAVFTWTCVPETKGKTLQEIQRELGGDVSGGDERRVHAVREDDEDAGRY